jgi:hypothetical protein
MINFHIVVLTGQATSSGKGCRWILSLQDFGKGSLISCGILVLLHDNKTFKKRHFLLWGRKICTITVVYNFTN